jgi:hypothetical protein
MSFYDDASLVFLAGGAAGKDGTAFNLKPVEELTGPNKVINGGFDSDSDWSKGTGWSISGGLASCDGTQTGNTGLSQLLSSDRLEEGETYKVTYTISNYVAGQVNPHIRGTSTGNVNGNGTKVVYGIAGNSASYDINFFADSNFNASIDNVSIRKVVNKAADFTFTRGSNLSATRVGKDGYIEKGREQLLVNTVWAGAGLDTAPTGYSLSITGSGTSNVTGVAGQIRFTAPTSSDRVYLNSAISTSRGLVAQSVFVDAVHTACKVDTLMRVSIGASATRIAIFEDGVEVNNTHIVQAGKRYTMVWNQVADAAFRFGMGCNGGVEGDVTLSRPQLEYGLVATAYIENTSTSATATAGLLEDEPRFDYTGGGCPVLLMEPERKNELAHSEYFGGWSIKSGTTETSNSIISPEGLQNASTISATTALTNYIGQNYTFTASTEYSYSVFVKNGTSSKMRLQVYDSSQYSTIDFDQSDSVIYSANLDSYDFVDYGNGWRRVIITFTTSAGAGSGYVQIYPDRNGNNEYLYVYGAQLEEGSYATSYIPTYGSSATRAKEYNECSFSGIGSQGTMFGEVEIKGDGVYGTPVALSDGDSTTNFILVYKQGDNKLSYRIRTGGVDQTSIASAVLAEGYHKFAFRFKENDCDFFVNGQLVESDSSATMPTGLDSIRQYIGTDTNKFHGGTKQLLYFPTVLSNNDTEILTGATSYRSFNVMASALNYTIYE